MRRGVRQNACLAEWHGLYAEGTADRRLDSERERVRKHVGRHQADEENRHGRSTDASPALSLPLLSPILPAWLPVQQVPDGAMLLGHLSRHHPEEVKVYLARIHDTADVTQVSVEAFEVVI